MWRYAATPWTESFQTNEGSFIGLTRYFAGHANPVFWWPYWNAGLPASSTYSPLLPWLAGRLTAATGVEAVTAFRWVSWVLFVALAPCLFLVVRAVSGRVEPALAAAALFTFLSPSHFLVPALARESGGVLESRRIFNFLYYGEMPHLAALAFALLFVWCAWRCVAGGERLFFWPATLFAALASLTNMFGCFSVALASTVLFFAVRRGAGTLLAMGGLAYAMVGFSMPPSSVREIFSNSTNIEHEFALNAKYVMVVVLTIALFVVGWLWRATAARKFGVLSALLFCGLVASHYYVGSPILFQAHRYQIEMDLAVCGLMGAWLAAPRWRTLALAAWVVLIGVQTVRLKQEADRLARPVEIRNTMQYRLSEWLERNYSGKRVMASGSLALWLNAFADLRQLSGGLDPMAINPVQRVAVFTIYSGMNAGAADGEISVLWLKAFGVQAVTVPGPASSDVWKPFARPEKFEGLLDAVYREGGDTVYRVPQHGDGLVVAVPESAIVRKTPAHGLDVEEVRRYVEAAERRTAMEGDVISYRVNWHPGWHAAQDAQELPVLRDGLGLIYIKPQGSGRVRFWWEPDVMTRALALVAVGAWIVLAGGWIMSARRRTAPREA